MNNYHLHKANGYSYFFFQKAAKSFAGFLLDEEKRKNKITVLQKQA